MDQLSRVAKHRAKHEQNDLKQSREDASKERLKTILQKRLSTVFIGDLARIEAFFGSLWGHGKAHQQKTENEKAWHKLWKELRKQTLDFGNDTIRLVEKELDQHTVCWNTYQYVLTAQKDKKENG